jgi:hypothetical protein
VQVLMTLGSCDKVARLTLQGKVTGAVATAAEKKSQRWGLRRGHCKVRTKNVDPQKSKK